jgi:Na+-transporting methylmalonyl-CoA/oxaloacetate decarboxylase gamma subunit
LIFSVLLILLSIIYLVSTWNDGDNKLNSQDVDEDENLKQKKQWTKEERMKVVKALYNATHPKREDQRQKDLERSLNNENKQEP